VSAPSESKRPLLASVVLIGSNLPTTLIGENPPTTTQDSERLGCSEL